MRHQWAVDTEFRKLVLDNEVRVCPHCGGKMRVCDHRHRRLHALAGPLHLVCKLAHCRAPGCPSGRRTVSPAAEMDVAPPNWFLAWDLLAHVGRLRFALHLPIPVIRDELATRGVRLSDDTLEEYLGRYQAMLAARRQDPAELAAAYAGCDGLVLSIDGLQPEKGHETLYVVRELTRRRVWFAASLLSGAAAEVRRVVAQARAWAETLGVPVRGWVSDKQDAFATAIAAEFPGVPHRLCDNHFLRDLAKPTLELDSHAKVRMRAKVRGLRAVEREILAAAAPSEASPSPSPSPSPPPPAAEAAVLDYCTAVRGVLNDDQGGPERPPGVRMAEALGEIRDSLLRNLAAKKGGAPSA